MVKTMNRKFYLRNPDRLDQKSIERYIIQIHRLYGSVINRFRVREMNRHTKLISWAFILMMAITLVPAGVTVSGETETKFGDGSEEKTVTFDDAGSDNSTTIKLPHEAEVREATLRLQGKENRESYLYHPTLLIEDEDKDKVLWNFNGSGAGASGYGHLGEQTVFQDNGTSSSLSFSGEEYKTTALYLPKNATVRSATMDISGKKSAGAMTPPEVLSNGTLITSSAAYPAVASDGSDLYMVWIDNGDLNYAGKDQDIFFKMSKNNGQTWGKAVCLSDSTMSSYAPSIAVNGNEVYVAWTEGELITNQIYFRMSKDGGKTWGKSVKIEGDTDWGSLPVVSSSGSYKYLVWDCSQKAYFTRSNDPDGEKWDKPKTISGGEKTYAYDPWIASYGNHVYVVWYETNEEDRTYSIVFKRSDNSGESFPKSPTTIESGKDSLSYPKIACNENGRVYTIWLKSDSMVRIRDLNYSYSTNQGSTWSEPKIIDDTDEDICSASISSERESGVNHVYVAWEDRYNVSFIRSTNEVSWSGSQNIVVNNGYSPAVTANNDGHVYVAYHISNQTSTLYNQDVYINVSDDQGVNWDDGTLISPELYDGDSQQSEIAVDGDDIYVVWQERGNISGVENGVDYDIFFKHYDGSSWSEITVLSDAIDDGSSTYPHIAVDGQNIYVVWQESQKGSNDNVDPDIVVRYSSNGGQSWNPIRVVSDDTNDGPSYYPRVAVSGSNGYVVWRDNRDSGGSGTDSDICFRRVSGGVPQGTTSILSDDPNDRNSENPDIAVDGQNLYVVWQENGNVSGSGTDYDICFRKSTNGGTSWGNIIVVTTDSSSSSYTPVISFGNYIYVAWREYSLDYYPYFSRSADGNTWTEQERITSKTANTLALTSNEDEVYLAFQYGLGIYAFIYLTSSQDAGDNWEDPVEETTDDSGYANNPALGFGDDTVHLCWDDNGNISGSGYDYDIIYRRSISSYPSDVTLDVGDDGSIDWQHPGELNDDNSPQTYSGSDFVDDLNTALSSAKYFTDFYGNDIATIILNLTSDTAGLVVLDNMRIEYDYTALVIDFNTTLNDYLKDHQDEQDGEGNIVIPLTITTDSAGKLTLSELYIEYELKKSLTILTPEEGGQYTTSIEITWEAKNFESGDEVDISYYDGSDWKDLTTRDASDESHTWDTSDENGRYYNIKIEYTKDDKVMAETEYFMIDNYPPTTKHYIDYGEERYEAPDDTVWGSSVTITLESDDDFEGGERGSGVDHTYYRIVDQDRGDWIEYTEPFTIEDHGEHTFEYYSVDKIGNNESEETKSGEAHIDAEEPKILDWTIPDVNYRTTGVVHVTYDVSDDSTGIDVDNSKLQYNLTEKGKEPKALDWESMENVKLDGGEFSGDINENWTKLTEFFGGTFDLHILCTIRDYVENENISQLKEVVEEDKIPPDIVEVGSEVDGDTDNMYFVGSEVRLYAVSNEDDLTGSVRINGGSTGGNFDVPLERDETTYFALWNTTDIATKQYIVIFTLTDSADNSATNNTLKILIEKIPYPELLVTGIQVEQNGVNGIENAIGEGILTNITVSVSNFGTMDVTNVNLTVYDDKKEAGSIIATELVDLRAGDTKQVSVDWTPGASGGSKTHTIIAVIEIMEGEVLTENNEHSEDVTVRSLPDFRIISITIQDEDGKEMTSANEEDRIKILVELENIGDAQASITVSAYYSGDTHIDSEEGVSIPAGETKTITLEWTSAVKGDQTITVKADPANDIMEKNEDNNEMSKSLLVKEGSGGEGEPESDDSGFPILIPIVIIIIGGIGAAGYFLMRKKKEDEWGTGPTTEEEMSWEEEGPAPAPRPAPIPMQERAAERPAPVPVKVKCPRCGCILSISTDKRPVTVKCPKCETKLSIKE